MDKLFKTQKQARDNVMSLQNYFTDLNNWETEMKRKDAALTGELQQCIPPIRSKVTKQKPLHVNKKSEKRISSFDYENWEKFDVDKACKEVDMQDIGPVSLDSKKSKQDKEERLREEAQYEKERGNNFVKQEKWDEAIKCYTRAIELVKNDAIYFANRGLCYLKKDSLHQAETDCTEALRLDPTYVKAFQRRAAARERLGSLKAASQDLNEVLRLEPHNSQAKRQLEMIKTRMGTKGRTKAKSSPLTTPTIENKSVPDTPKVQVKPKVIEFADQPPQTVEVKELTPIEKWRQGGGENITVITPVKKPPYLRSKRALIPIQIEEIPLGTTILPDIPNTCIDIINLENNKSNDSNKIHESIMEKVNLKGDGDTKEYASETEKMIIDSTMSEKGDSIKNLEAPNTSVQFLTTWRVLNREGQSDYLNLIEPCKIPSIFENALESDLLSQMLSILYTNADKFKEKTVTAYLKGLCRVKRFSALAMFLSSNDKELLTKLLNYCKVVENCTDEEIADLKNKYEL